MAAVFVVILGAIEFQIRNTGLKHTNSLEKRISITDKQIAGIAAGVDLLKPLRGRQLYALSLKELREIDREMDKILSGIYPSKLSVEKQASDWSFVELQAAVRERAEERGTAWFGCVVSNIEERERAPALQQLVARIIITGPPDERGIETDAASPDILGGVVYVFHEELDNETNQYRISKFLGRFNVEGNPMPTQFFDREQNQKNGFLITLVTADPVSGDEIVQIIDETTQQHSWAIFTSPPVDRVAGIFDQLSEEEKQIFPVELLEQFQPRTMDELTDNDVEELLSDFKALAEDWSVEPEERQKFSEAVEMWERASDSSQVKEIWNLYRAKMDDPAAESSSDFSILLDWLYLRRSGLLRGIAVAKADIKTLEEVEDKTKKENEKLEEDCLLEEKREKAMGIQRDAVNELLDEYETEVRTLGVKIEKLQVMAAAYVAKIVEYQLMAIEKIEERVEKVEDGR